jgi:hypothetical protein
MLKNILTLEGVSLLTKGEQQTVNGGKAGTCAALVTAPNGSQVLSYDIDRGTVDGIISGGTSAGYRVQWCCSSCASASWL